VKVTKKILKRLAHNIINEYDMNLRKTIGSLAPKELMFLHHAFVKAVLEYEEDDTLFEAITVYVEGLSRLQRGYFWKVLNYFEWNLSARWYKHSRRNLELILYSLACVPQDKEWIDVNDSDEYRIRIASLDRVFDLTVKEGTAGLTRNSGKHKRIPPTPKG